MQRCPNPQEKCESLSQSDTLANGRRDNVFGSVRITVKWLSGRNKGYKHALGGPDFCRLVKLKGHKEVQVPREA